VLTENKISELMATALEERNLTGRRVLVIIPDRTRSGPIGLFFRLFCKLVAPRVAALNFLIALGTHPPMSDEAMRQHLGLTALEWENLPGNVRVWNHEWWKPEVLATVGKIGADQVEALTAGLIAAEIPVRLNRLVLNYDQLIICGPVFPHEVVGFSGGSKYLFPGIAGSEIINFTHWLGALQTSYAIIGTKETPVREVIEQAAAMVPISQLAFCFVVRDGVVAGLYIGEPREAWGRAADLSAQCHIIYLNRPAQRVLSIMPEMYDDIWTAAKGMYKVEPVVSEGGEVVIYAPHITALSYTHGDLISRIGYHVRDFFVEQWNSYRALPWAVLAHSTHLRGIGTYDPQRGVETPRIQVTLATGIAHETCARVNLGYANPDTIQPGDSDWTNGSDTLVVERAGEILYRLHA
jgi:nickel-dependent lactate racemase